MTAVHSIAAQPLRQPRVDSCACSRRQRLQVCLLPLLPARHTARSCRGERGDYGDYSYLKSRIRLLPNPPANMPGFFNLRVIGESSRARIPNTTTGLG